ncbi:conserved hypothetical protein [Desulforapulum autotrophicum HRM2]|uniref:VCBS repeat-containing protein n=1 Tax=Desulforapulum autotrophicum (strain ATCC 43914 / DSM 3382 / VKM B-1955 / HRM2) TaxID=177437 RepID=C0QKZ2_DESAH|nr:FG-GAP-like repeat-containing protein [Desulforapulum autotrophicum]ACN16232.1 conserved hypothetical protein [Desulforapulum autotrophicum HRM2]
MKSGKTTIVLAILILFTCLAGSALAATTRILVKPFNIEADQAYPFLEKGIFKMLLSRLEIPGVCTPVLDTDPDAGQADYVLNGTILIFGDGISTDAKLLNAKTGASALVFNELGASKGDALAHVNHLSEQIKMDVLGLDSGKRATPQAINQTAIEQQAPVRQPAVKAQLWRSQAFDERIISLDLADVTGDTKNETIVASKNKLTLLTREGKVLKKISTFEPGINLNILSVDAGDINNNHKAEIYLTCIDERTFRPSSLVLEWNGTGFTTLLDNEPLLFRIIRPKTRGTLLLGQTPREKGQMLNTPVFQLSWQANTLVEAELKLPRNITIYSFTYGDVMNNGSEMIAALTLDGRVKVFSSEGRESWKSAEGYGGSVNFLEYKGNLHTRDDGYQMTRFFLQQRIFIADLEGDGKNRVIVVRNEDSASILKKTRYFSKGTIVSLAWDEMGLAPEGRTRSFPGYFSDYLIGDMDNDGHEELIYAVTRSEGMVDQNHSSRLYSQDRIAANSREFY